MDGEIWVLVPLATFAMFCFVAWVIYRTKVENRATDVMAGLHNRMIDKFGSSEEFVKFLQTEDGKRYLTSFTERPEANPAQKVVTTAKTGVILTMLSLGFVAAGFFTGYEPRDNPAIILGFIGLFLGGGFLISAVAGHVLSKALDIYETKGARD